MAIIDLPNTAAFRGATWSLGLDVSEAVYTGFYTGNRQRVSNLADRLRGTLTLPPCGPADAAAREALLFALRSNGDWLRMGMPHRAVPLGNMRGAVTAAANASAGARSVALQGALAGPNLLNNSGFEIDSNSDGVADGWVASVLVGSAGTFTRGRSVGPIVPNSVGGMYQFLAASALNGRMQLERVIAGVVPGLPYTLAADISCTGGLVLAVAINWLTAAGAYISDVTATGLPTAPGRRAVSGVAPAGSVSAFLGIYVESAASASALLNVDNVQFEQAPSATPYAGAPTLRAGDVLGIGGNLLMVGPAGAVLNDAGAGVVPLATPLPRAVSAGAAVTLNAPAGLWELDDDLVQFDYSAGLIQQGVSIPLRQVIA